MRHTRSSGGKQKRSECCFGQKSFWTLACQQLQRTSELLFFFFLRVGIRRARICSFGSNWDGFLRCSRILIPRIFEPFVGCFPKNIKSRPFLVRIWTSPRTQKVGQNTLAPETFWNLAHWSFKTDWFRLLQMLSYLYLCTYSLKSWTAGGPKLIFPENSYLY